MQGFAQVKPLAPDHERHAEPCEPRLAEQPAAFG